MLYKQKTIFPTKFGNDGSGKDYERPMESRNEEVAGISCEHFRTIRAFFFLSPGFFKSKKAGNKRRHEKRQKYLTAKPAKARRKPEFKQEEFLFFHRTVQNEFPSDVFLSLRARDRENFRMNGSSSFPAGKNELAQSFRSTKVTATGRMSRAQRRRAKKMKRRAFYS